MMDLATAINQKTQLTTEVCIIGAGVAGQTVAKQLARAGRDVVLVESGGLDFKARTQDLATGDVIGEPYYQLDQSRLRLFGGTTAIWGGRCATFDPIDFEKRDWVPYSGWPISYDELDPYVDAAFASVDLFRPRGYDSINAIRPDLDSDKMDIPLWGFDEKGERFTDVKNLPSDRVMLVLNANLTELQTKGGKTLQQAVFHSLNKRELQVTAKAFVLAAGGIETPRLMLACSPDRPEGIGNSKGLVGRFFMEHPHARGGRIIPTDTEALTRLVSMAPRGIRHNGLRYTPAFRLSEAEQIRQKILNSVFSLSVRKHPGLNQAFGTRLVSSIRHQVPAKKILRRLYHYGKNYRNRLVEKTDLSRQMKKLTKQGDEYGLYTVIRAEQAPNPDSRIRLTHDKDVFGLPKAALNWKLSEIDGKTVSAMMQVFGQEISRLKLGSLEPSAWLNNASKAWEFDPIISSHPIGGYHHMGTTRMAAAPDQGVVDRDCRVFDCPNLYIAGSSVFPTSGWANPTIPIIALAMRLGDNLNEHL